MTFVPITRHFRDGTSDLPNAMSQRMLRGIVESITWEDLVPAAPEKHVVLVAASGLGKTREMQEQVTRLRAQGRLALFLAARTVVEDKGRPDTLDARATAELERIRTWLPRSSIEAPVPDAPSELAELLTSTESDPIEGPSLGLTKGCPVVFLDAVDEVVLAGRSVEVVFPLAVRMLGEVARRCQWVLSARGGWSAEHARSFLRALTRDPAELRVEPSSWLRDVTFAPLDDDAVRELAKAAHCRELESFLGALRTSEIESNVDLRPMDVPRLVARWNRLGALGSWAEIYDDYVRMALEAHPEPRDDARTLTVDAARHGAERVGAATVFAKTPFLSVPTIPTKPDTIGSRELFADWTTRATRELFETALFHKKGDDSLQLQPGQIPAFLAASWLVARARGGKNAEWLRDRLMVRVFGEERYVLPESRSATAGWVASFVPAFRKHLGQQPSVVLYEGDPDHLNDHEIVEWLDRVLDRVRQDGRSPASRGTVFKLARPSIEGAVVSRIAIRNEPRALQLLFRWAAVGRYTTALPTACTVALDTANDTWLRVAAIDVIESCGDEASRVALEALVADKDSYVRDALTPVLIPRLRGDALVEFLRAGGTDSFSYHLREELHRVPTEQVEYVLGRLLEWVRSPSTIEESASCFAVALELLAERLRRPGPQPAIVVAYLLEIEASRGRAQDRFVPIELSRSIVETVAKDDALRRALWLARLDSDRHTNLFEAVFRAQYGHQDLEDLAWLMQLSVDRPELGDIARYAARTLIERLDDASLVRLRSIAEEPVLELLLEVVGVRDHLAAKRREHDEERRREQEEVRARNLVALERRRPAIARGEDYAAIEWAWLRIRREGDHDALRVHLTDLIGSEIAVDLVQGISRLWRIHDVEVPDPENRSYPVRVSVALAGIGFAVADGLDFRALDPALAGRAARYALYSLNELPPWFPALLEAHEQVALERLRELVAREWTATSKPLSTLRFAPYAPARVAEALRSIARDLLLSAETNPPVNPEALESSVTAILTADRPADDALRDIARAAVDALAGDDVRRTTWLRLWTHLDPIAVAKWLTRLPESTRRDTVVAVAASLENDFDRRRVGAVSRLLAPDALERWAALLSRELPPDHDERPNGYVKPRHDAQDMRDWCLRRLYQDPSPAARAALERLAHDDAMKSQPGWGERLLAIQYATAVEHAAVPWSERTILTLEQEDEATPRSLPELFALVRRHLDDVARLLETDEFSYRELFDPETKEREIQLWAASSLQLRARGLYTVMRENVVAHDKEVDITAAVPGVGQVPIEIKPANRYTLKELQSTIRDQLLGRYMTQHDRTKGVLLLVAHERRMWRPDGEKLTFVEVVERLRTYARDLGTNAGKEIAVHGIDVASSRPTKSKQTKDAKPKT